VDGLRLITIAPELPGAIRLIGRLRERGVVEKNGERKKIENKGKESRKKEVRFGNSRTAWKRRNR